MTSSPNFTAVEIASVPGWSSDDQTEALTAFRTSARALAALEDASAGRGFWAGWLAKADAAQSTRCPAHARAFFEDNFAAWHVTGRAETASLVTGYFEPVYRGSLTARPGCEVPIYRRPAELVAVIDDVRRGTEGERLTYMRRGADGLEPYPTRAEIEAGALSGHGLELVYLTDPVDAFTLHVQGSGCIELDDGSVLRVGYDGKNGHPYTSIGRYLIETGEIAEADMTLQVMEDWLRARPDGARAVMARNASFVFFKPLGGADARPVGARDIPLVAGRSLAVDAGVHRLGFPIFVSAPDLTDGSNEGFHRLMVAHDVGSAIRGAVRGDIYFGSGPAAGIAAGRVRHRCEFWSLMPMGMAPSGQGER